MYSPLQAGWARTETTRGRMAVPNLQLLGLLLLCLCAAAAPSQPYHRRMMPAQMAGPFVPRPYTRAADVARRCRSVLSSAAELTADDADVLVNELTFSNGDWRQDAGHAPLMPFPVGRRAGAPEACPGLHSSPEAEATPLAAFTFSHVDTAQQRQQHTRRAINVSGVLSLTVSGECCHSETPPHRHVSPEFKLEPRVARLDILFEGVYAETGLSSDGDERVLCMVGNAVLPMRGGNGTDPWDWAKNAGAGTFKPPVMVDSNVVLVLRYPMAHTLTSRAVHGEMTSTKAKSDDAYFDTVRLVSRLGQYATYQFRPEDEELAATGCSQRPFFCGDVAGDCAGGLYRGASFCDILYEFAIPGYGMLASVVPNWKCNSTDEFCSRLGPFVSSAGRDVADLAIAMQDVRCKPTSEPGGGAAALVSSVFRAVPSWEDQNTAVRRSGLSGLTMSAEGVWSASSGQLCMTGCMDGGNATCRHRVSLYVATTFSLARRGVILGKIAAMDGSHLPLLFQVSVPPRKSWNNLAHYEESLRMQYSYGKVVQIAGELLRKSSSNFAAKLLLSYPKDAGAGDDMMSLSHLSDILGLKFDWVPKLQFMPEWSDGSGLHLQILSIGPLVGSYQPPTFQQQRRSSMPLPRDGTVDSHGGERQREPLLNVSAEFTVPPSRRFSLLRPPVMSLEGVYSPEDGRMYLIGCRNVRPPRRLVSKIGDLENGMDCTVEVEVEYPPTTAWWLFTPTATAYISSTRAASDPLHFNRTKLRSAPVTYRGHPDMLLEKNIEGLLCITMLSATMAAALGQLRYMKSHPDVAPYVSLAMLGVQALGYGMVLVTEARMLPSWPTGNYRMHIGHLCWDMDCSVRSLTLATLLVTLRLAQRVRRSRIRARARAPLDPGRVPSDAAVLLYSLGAYLFVFVAYWVGTYGGRTTSTLPSVVEHAEAHGGSYARTDRGDVVERYIGVVKELFLLPQVIGNAVWRVNCRPLRKRYYAGVTGVWLLPHVYRYLRPPVVYMYAQGETHCGSAVVHVAAPFIAVVLALSIYVQHRCNYKIVGWAFGKERNKVQHVY